MDIDADRLDALEVPRTNYAGLADVLTGSQVTGWAIDEAAPSEVLTISIIIDAEMVESVRCDLPRGDLRGAGLPGDVGGFSFAIPDHFLDGESHILRLAFQDGVSLPFNSRSGGPISEVHFRSERSVEVDGFVDGLVGSGIRGWALRRDTYTGHATGNVKIKVSCNGVPVAEIVADQVRQDVAQAKQCPPNVGFDFQVPAEFRTGSEFKFSLHVAPEDVELRQSPITISYPSTDAISRLYSLKGQVDDLCARTWSIQRQIASMLPTGGSVGTGYDVWARRYYADLRQRIAALPPLSEPAPLVSIIVPIYRPHLGDLVAAIDSVRRQTYANWELLMVDDASGSRALTSFLREVAAQDQRITLTRRRRNGGISTATNTALRRVTGDYVVLFDHDDLLEDVAIETMVRAALATRAKILYSDEDKIDGTGSYSEPNLKPDWNYRLLLSQNYICHLLMVEWALLRRVGPFRKLCDGAQDHDLLLRLSETSRSEEIHHVPEILYHWRKSASSTASSGEAKTYAIRAGISAVESHLHRRGFNRAQVTSIGSRTMYSVNWRGEEEPSVQIIIPFKDQAVVTRRCLEDLCNNTEYRNWRIILVDNGSTTPEAKKLCRDVRGNPRVSVRHLPGKFNFSLLNNVAAKESVADFYMFLNNDVFIEQRNWLRVLVDEALSDPRVAIVGAKLVYPNQTLQHGGIVLGVGGIADHAFRGLVKEDAGYVGRAWCAQQYAAVTAACMLVRTTAFRDLGGFDETDLAVAYNDVDLCLRATTQGWRVIWTPDLTAEHHESLSRGDDMAPAKAARFFHENQVMHKRWGEMIQRDPFYNPLFSRSAGIFNDLEEVGSRR